MEQLETGAPLNRVVEIQETLQARAGSKIHMRANMGRSRIIERDGTLIGAHPSLFVIETIEKRGRTARQSYQYADILTGMVELFDPETGESWFPDCARDQE